MPLELARNVLLEFPTLHFLFAGIMAGILVAAVSGSATEAWSYDPTVALVIAAVWWLAEFCSAASQRRLYHVRDLNIAWSLLTVLLGVAVVASIVAEQVLRELHGLSIPTTIATIVAASISYILVADRLRLMDPHAVLMQRLLRSDKLRFGRVGSRGVCKYTIVWARWRSGNPESSWSETLRPPRRLSNDQVLLDWGLEHRLGDDTPAQVASELRWGGDRAWSQLGRTLYSWLPGQSYDAFEFGDGWKSRGRLRGAYMGARGSRLGCQAPGRSFEDWLAFGGVHRFQLIAMEYQEATGMLLEELSSLSRQAQSAEELAAQFLELWAMCIDRANGGGNNRSGAS